MRDDGAWMDGALHDLCQPLTALQCRLFLATMAAGGRNVQGRWSRRWRML